MYGRKKQIIAGLLALFIFLTFRGVFADGTCGTNVKYTIDGNTISFAKGDGTEDPKWEWVGAAGSNCGAVFRDDNKITSVKVTEKISVTNGTSLFSGFRYVREMDLSKLDVSAVTDMDYMFASCSSLSSLDVSDWDTSSVTDMGNMFNNCKFLKSLDVSGWDTSSVINMANMFYNCSSLSSLDVSGWDTSGVEDMHDMFNYCSSLTSLDVSGWDTSSVTDMTMMFVECSSLKSLDVSGWDTSQISYSQNMFYNCGSLQTLALGKNTVGENIFESLPAYDSMWYYLKTGAAARNPLPLKTGKAGSGLFGAYNSGQMAGVWSTDPDLVLAESIKIEYPAGTDVTGETVPVDSTEVQLAASALPDGAGQKFFWRSGDPKTASVDADGNVTFKKVGTAVITVKAADGSGVSAQTALSLPGKCGTNVKYTVSGNTISFAKGDGTEDPKWEDGAGLNCGAVFKEDTEITSVKVTEKISVTDGKQLFRSFRLVREMDLSKLDVSAVTGMSYMFRDCGSLESLDLSGWDTSAVKSMIYMFRDCGSLTSLDLSGWDTSSVNEMAYMFAGCGSLKSLDVSGWDTSGVTNMGHMFRDCRSLKTLALGKNTVSQNIFETLPAYNNSTWYYLKTGAAAAEPLPLKTGKAGSELFGDYDSDQMAGVWSTDPDLVLAESITIEYPAGTDITGQTVPLDSAEVQLAASASPDGAGQKFFWRSGDPKTASVDADGNVTFKKAGKVTITVKAADCSGVTAETALTYGLAESVKILGPDGADITGGAETIDTTEYQLKAKALPEGVPQEFTWKSSDPDIAAVSKTGKVTFKKAGTVTVTAAADDGSEKSAEVTLTLEAEEDPAEITAEAEVIRGGNKIDLDDLVTSAAGDVSFAIDGEDLGCNLDPDSHVLTSGEKTGTVTVAVSVADSDFHYGKTGTVTVTVKDKNKEDLAVSQQAAVFGGTLPAPEYSAPEGTVSKAVLYSGADYGPSEEPPSKPGSYTVTVSCETKDTVYTGTADFTIAPKAMTVSAENVTDSFDGKPHGITVTVTDPSASAKVTYGKAEGTYDLDVSPAITDVSESPLTVYFKVTAANYSDYTGSAVVTITAEKLRTEQSQLTEVPEVLQSTYASVSDLQNAMIFELKVNGEPARIEQTVFVDVVLEVSFDGGEHWEIATPDNFPAGGMEVRLKYPEGTGKDTHQFSISHMFTVGEKAGQVEYPDVTPEDDGLYVWLTGLSPVAIAWREINTPGPEPERPRMEFFRLHADCELPATGFSSLRPTVLPEQPKDLRYEPARMHLMLPTLDRDVELVTMPREGNSWAAARLGADAGILEGSALPGEGVSIIAAHNTLNDTDYGPFALLSTLEVNDTVMVREESGALKLFRVYANELLEPDDMERLSALAGDNALVLLTCENESPSGGYLNRRAVFAKENKK